jgi:hypothetical protein
MRKAQAVLKAIAAVTGAAAAILVAVERLRHG